MRPVPDTRPAGAATEGPPTPEPEPDVLHLVTTGRRSGQPREIEIWFTRADQRVYLVAESGPRAAWVRNLLAQPRVTWRLAGRTWHGRARVVEAEAEPDLCRQVRARSVARYGWGDGLVVELTPADP